MNDTDYSLFSHGSDELRQALERIATKVTLDAGETLFTQGDEGESFYFLRDGEVEISVLSPSGRRLALEVMQSGEIFGEIALFGGTRTATAVASRQTVLGQVRRRDVLRAFHSNPDLSLEFINLLCERIRVISHKLEQRVFLALPARLANCLLRLEARIGDNSGSIPVSQAELAQFVGATREGVAKTLADWKGQDWVDLGRGSVRILDQDALQAIAESDET